jgi:hypothetical protein
MRSNGLVLTEFLTLLGAIAVISMTAGCHWFIMGDGLVAVTGQIDHVDDTQCNVRAFYENGHFISQRTVPKKFKVSFVVSPTARRFSFEVACAELKWRSSVRDAGSPRNVDLGTVTVK